MTSSAPASMWPATRSGISCGWPTVNPATSSGEARRRQHLAHLGRVLARCRQDQRRHPGDVDLGRIPAHLGAVTVEHLDLAGQRGHVTGHIALVGVPGDQPKRPLLATAADHDLRAAGLDRPGQITGMIEPVVAAGEADVVAGEHGPADLNRLLEHVQPHPVAGYSMPRP